MATLGDYEPTAKKAGLPLDDLPGVIVPIFFSGLVLENILAYLSFRSFLPIPDELFHTAIVMLSLLLGVITYLCGNFWDDKVFDPRYGIAGTWTSSDKRHFGILTPGLDLDTSRRLAVAALMPAGSNGRGIYRQARRALRERGDWGAVVGPLAWSKAFRSLIWPSLLIALGCLGLSLGHLAFGWPGEPQSLLIVAVLSFVFAMLAFIPYLDLRVAHLMLLYELASRPSTSPSGPGAR
jgi:hypothetical protein